MNYMLYRLSKVKRYQSNFKKRELTIVFNQRYEVMKNFLSVNLINTSKKLKKSVDV